jgi:hypothetical protein
MGSRGGRCGRPFLAVGVTMYLRQRFSDVLANLDDAGWQAVLERHAFWKAPGVCLDAEHEDIAFHILMHEGELALDMEAGAKAFEFDAMQVPRSAFDDVELRTLTEEWAAMHATNYGSGLTTKMGLYVIRSGGVLGFHVDGPVFLKGMRADLSAEHLQRGLIEVNASHRTVLPLRFNAADDFMVCAHRIPMSRGQLFEFSNVLPHAYLNRGPEHAVLLVTTYLEEGLLPDEYAYAAPAERVSAEV